MKGLLLVNTGSPASPQPKDVKMFIEAMLSDPLVMTVPDWFRTILVKGIIGPTRQFASAKKYSLIWDEEINTSTLIYNAKELAKKVEEQAKIPVEVGMRYLEPCITKALTKLAVRNSELTEVVVLPLFPHYAQSSYQTVVEKVQDCYQRGEYTFSLRIIEPYFNHKEYIDAICESIKPYLRDDYERILFNFHSLPLSHVEEGFEKGVEFDYVYQVKETVRLITHQMDLEAKKVRVVFSSAFGKKWLEPSLDDQVGEMAEEGIKKILVVSPGFASDNLETLYDIDIAAKDIFINKGGEQLTYIPCLNASQAWVDAIQQIIL